MVERARPINLVPTEEPKAAAMVMAWSLELGAWLAKEARGETTIPLGVGCLLDFVWIFIYVYFAK